MVAASQRALEDSALETTLVPQHQHSTVQCIAGWVGSLASCHPGRILSGPASLSDDNWLLEKKETVRHFREIASVSSPGRPWTANFRSECLCLPVVADPLALQVDPEKLRFADGARVFASVIAILQTMVHDAGYAFLNLVPTWGRTLSPELLAAQDNRFMSDASFLWNEIARERHYSVRRDDAPFQTLDPETASAFPVKDDGDTLMQTLEEQELLGTAMVTRLRLAHMRPRDWSESDMRRQELKRHRGSTTYHYLCLRGPVRTRPLESGEALVGTSSLASGDAPKLTPDENMSSAGGGSQGPLAWNHPR
ncbi:hypothetical protein PHMEG_00025115 [Phytophthora megakarya]|uniref:Uncharacterized protein n=1 Tax=Phytophthora megakarya TaxID=4795 RepID=A0A225VCU7_9STRA|nr:hypothetical protein PHMEG_00025115 [Phytophthora megakarya]